MSELRDPEFRNGTTERTVQDFSEARTRIKNFGPTLIYNGTDKMNHMADNALDGVKSIIPREKANITGKGILNTADQMRTFKLPDELHKPGGEIAIVAHSPHFVRILRMLNNYKNLPTDMKVRVFPLRMPKGSEYEYSLMEIRGLLANVYSTNPPRATIEPHPHIIHGAK